MVGGRCRIAIFLAVCLVKAHGITLEERVNHHLMKSAATGRATEMDEVEAEAFLQMYEATAKPAPIRNGIKDGGDAPKHTFEKTAMAEEGTHYQGKTSDEIIRYPLQLTAAEYAAAEAAERARRLAGGLHTFSGFGKFGDRQDSSLSVEELMNLIALQKKKCEMLELAMADKEEIAACHARLAELQELLRAARLREGLSEYGDELSDAEKPRPPPRMTPCPGCPGGPPIGTIPDTNMHIYYTPKAGAEMDDEYRMLFARHIRESVAPTKQSLEDVSCLCDYRRESRSNYYPPLRVIRDGSWLPPPPSPPSDALDAAGERRNTSPDAFGSKKKAAKLSGLDSAKSPNMVDSNLASAGSALNSAGKAIGPAASAAAGAIGDGMSAIGNSRAGRIAGKSVDLLEGGLDAGIAVADSTVAVARLTVDSIGVARSAASSVASGASAVHSTGKSAYSSAKNFFHRRRLLGEKEIARNVTCFCHNGPLKFDKERNVDDIMNGFKQEFDPSESQEEHSGLETLITTPLEGGKSIVVPVLSVQGFKVGGAVTIGRKAEYSTSSHVTAGSETEETRGIVAVGEGGIPAITLTSKLIHDHKSGSILRSAQAAKIQPHDGLVAPAAAPKARQACKFLFASRGKFQISVNGNVVLEGEGDQKTKTVTLSLRANDVVGVETIEVRETKTGFISHLDFDSVEFPSTGHQWLCRQSTNDARWNSPSMPWEKLASWSRPASTGSASYTEQKTIAWAESSMPVRSQWLEFSTVGQRRGASVCRFVAPTTTSNTGELPSELGDEAALAKIKRDAGLLENGAVGVMKLVVDSAFVLFKNGLRLSSVGTKGWRNVHRVTIPSIKATDVIGVQVFHSMPSDPGFISEFEWNGKLVKTGDKAWKCTSEHQDRVTIAWAGAGYDATWSKGWRPAEVQAAYTLEAADDPELVHVKWLQKTKAKWVWSEKKTWPNRDLNPTAVLTAWCRLAMQDIEFN